MDSENREDLLKVLSNLKALKKCGKLDEDKYFLHQEQKWRNILDYSVIESCMKHHCSSVRLDALALISESKKTTQPFTSAEFNIIFMFLKYNLGEKLEFVPFIKKILKRANGSLIVLQRQLTTEEKLSKSEKNDCSSLETYNESNLSIHERIEIMNMSIKSYYSFFSSLRDLCLNNLYPGAVHCRKRSALQIMNLMQEFLNEDIKSKLWKGSDTDLLVQCLISDTYETNKELVFKIMKCIEPSLLNLNNAEAVHEIIDTALDLANSMRPIDTITASYMLKMTALSPIIDDALCNYTNAEEKNNCVAESTVLRIIRILLNRLMEPLQLAKENIVLACSKHSLYGYLFCIESQLQMLDLRKLQREESWRKLIAEILDMCFELSDIVSKIVNNSSPEGHLPMDLNVQNNICLENPEAPLVTSQMVLLCSWRTIKETSLLFGNITSRCPTHILESDPGLISEQQVEKISIFLKNACEQEIGRKFKTVLQTIRKIGVHFVTLLCETKHRGAFEQAYVGFQLMCNQLCRSTEECLQNLPLVWLHYLFLDISGLKSGNFKLCSTRRSAGVPFMVQAITCSSSWDNSNYSVFHSVMKILLEFTQLTESENLCTEIKRIMYGDTVFSQFEEVTVNREDQNIFKDIGNDNTVTEIKTHALNILRALFKHHQLGDLVQEYISDGFKVAMRSYDGKSWAERNAATLLIGTLITRTFGVLRTKDYINLTSHNKMTGKVFFEKYVDLLPFMLEKLYNFIANDNELIDCNIQPILLITSRLYNGSCLEKSNSSWQVDKFIDLVSQSGTNRVYKTRELAARALVSLLTEENISEILNLLRVNIMNTHDNSNALHGYMLQLHGIVSVHHLSANIMTKNDFCNFLRNMECNVLQRLENSNKKSACFITATSFINTLSGFLKQSSVRCLFDEELLDDILHRVQMHLGNHEILKERPGKDFYETMAMDLIVSCMINSYSKKLLKDQNKNTSFWLSVLTHTNENVQIIGWRTVFSIIKKIKNKKLLDQTIFIALNTRFESVANFEVQDAIYDFLYVTLSHLQPQNEERTSCTMDVNDHQPTSEMMNQFNMIIGSSLNAHMQEKYFYERGHFLKLLCKNYACFSRNSEDNSSFPISRNEVYDLVVNNSWMCSADLDCRIEIAKNLYGLYIESADVEESCFILNWWTTLLYLLLDDNKMVRHYASIVVCDIRPKTDLECHASTMKVFFEKFLNSVGNKNPSAGLAALISWSMTLMEDEEFEMDETEVFNRSSNYECFEPSWLSRKCSEVVQLILKNDFVNEAIPESVKNWLSQTLNLQLCEINTFQELIIKYKNHVPCLEGRLRDILDPTYNSKLMQFVAYENLLQQIVKVC